MTVIRTLWLAAALGLGGCAHQSPAPVLPGEALRPPLVIAAAPESGRNARPVEAPAAPPLIPTGPLQPITAAQAASMGVAQLQPPADLWERIRRGFSMPDLENDLVHDREQWYANRPDYILRMTERSRKYLFHIVEELERRDMPTELALLPFIESAYNPQAMSSAKASGMWQFIPSTGKDYALKQNVFRDDRRDVLASTRAALDYLNRLHDMFGDWQLALAAYNWGEGSVQRAIVRNQKLGRPTDYLSLNMPGETRWYLPKLQAVKNIIARPEAFALRLPPLANHPYFLGVPIERDIDVALAAKFAGLPIDEFKNLNPQMNKPVILAAGTPQLLLPYDNADQFVRNLGRHQGALASWTAWVAPKTLRPADAARQVGMSELALREVNRIPPRMLVKVGSTLLVPRSEHKQADVPGPLADNATISLAPDLPPARRISFTARKRDTVASIARRYHLSPAQVAQWNKLGQTAAFRPGQAVVVYVPTKAGKAGRTTRYAKAKARPGARQMIASKARRRAQQSG